VGGLGGLESHEFSIGGEDRIGSLAAFVVVEVRQASEIFAGAVEPQFPDVDVAGAACAAKLLAVAVCFHGGVMPIGKNSFDFVVAARRLGEIGNRAGGEIDAHHGGEPLRLVASESHLVVVVVKILGFERAAFVFAFVDDFLVDDFRRAAGK